MGRLAAMLAVGALCYVAVAWPLNRLAQSLADEPRAAVIGHKLAFLRAHAADYDLLLLGSSRIHYDLDPAVLDAGLREAGCPARSYNFGVQGLTAAEHDWLTAKLAEIGAGRWKAVLIERLQLPLRTWRFVGSARHRIGHMQPGQVWLSLQALATSTRSRLNAAVDMAQVAMGHLYYQLGPGQLADLVKSKPAEIPDEGFTIELSRAGFVPLEQEISPLLKARADRTDWDEFTTRLIDLRTHPPEPRPLSPTRLDHLRAQIEAARRVAPAVVFAMLPQAIRLQVDDGASIVEAAASGELGRVVTLNLGDPTAHPELFADGIWFDDDHLMGDGTRRLGMKLGRMLCDALPALRAGGA